MLWFKACPRCLGDLILESDLYGQSVSCLQCGCILDEQQVRGLPLSRLGIHRAGGHRDKAGKVRESPIARAG